MSDDLTYAEARAILGLAPDAGRESLVGAFRAAVKQAHPDRPGGDSDRFRRILEAYRLLLIAAAAPEPTPATNGFVEAPPLVAAAGGEVEAVLADGGRTRVWIAPGTVDGETLEVAGERITVRIVSEATQVRGSDIWITAQVPASVLAEGGRAKVMTPAGEQTLWVSRKVAERRLLRLEGQGLPARGPFPPGDLLIRLEPDEGAPESVLRTRLRKFAAAWAA